MINSTNTKNNQTPNSPLSGSAYKRKHSMATSKDIESEPFIVQNETSDEKSRANSRDVKTTQETVEYQYIRYFFLFALCLQNSSYTLLRRWSTGILVEKASDSSILIGGELIKIGVSLFMTFCSAEMNINIGSMPMPNGKVAHFKKIIKTSPKMFVPAFVYYCMNRLSFVALRRIDAGTFTVVAQLKTLTTATFSWLILSKQFSAVRVRSLIYLVCSVIVISEFAATHSVNDARLENVEDKASVSWIFMFGLFAVMTEVTLSGLISVYYQKVLQDDKRNLSAWDRNIQESTIIQCYIPDAFSSRRRCCYKHNILIPETPRF